MRSKMLNASLAMAALATTNLATVEQVSAEGMVKIVVCKNDGVVTYHKFDGRIPDSARQFCKIKLTDILITKRIKFESEYKMEIKESK
jgi:hypothetical protein